MQTWLDMTLGELLEEIETADGDIFPVSRSFIILAEVMEKILRSNPDGIPDAMQELAANFVNGMGTILEPVVLDLSFDVDIDGENEDSGQEEVDPAS